jgi:hypothetical protein
MRVYVKMDGSDCHADAPSTVSAAAVLVEDTGWSSVIRRLPKRGGDERLINSIFVGSLVAA